MPFPPRKALGVAGRLTHDVEEQPKTVEVLRRLQLQAPGKEPHHRLPEVPVIVPVDRGALVVDAAEVCEALADGGLPPLVRLDLVDEVVTVGASAPLDE